MRQLKGYLSYSGVQRHLQNLADERSQRTCQQLVQQMVPDEFSGCIQTALLRSGELVVLVDQPHRAAWFRARQQRLLRDLGTACRVTSLKIVTSPSLFSINRKPGVSTPPPAPGAAEVVDQSARDISSPNLRNAMQRLAKRMKTVTKT